MRLRPRFLALLTALAMAPDWAMADDARIAEFLGPRGCVIGPGTQDAATAAGIDAAALAEFGARAAALPGSVQTGDWLVITPDMCRISFAPIKGELSLSDPEVQASFSAVDAYAEYEDYGCFLDGDKLRERLVASRGWDEDRAFKAYLDLVGAGIQSGEMAFHSPSPLKTPAGFVLTTGSCGEAPGMDAVRRDHDLLMRHLDAHIRHHAAATPCEEGAIPLDYDEADFLPKMTDGAYQNAWGWFEVVFMAMASGWYEGASLTRKGMPRPPLCHFPAP